MRFFIFFWAYPFGLLGRLANEPRTQATGSGAFGVRYSLRTQMHHTDYRRYALQPPYALPLVRVPGLTAYRIIYRTSSAHGLGSLVA
jgi:hypothetical protein